MNRIAFIGAGNMASAIIGGLIANKTDPKTIIAADPFPPQLEKLESTLGIQVTNDNKQAIEGANIVLLAVKPQQMQQVCEAIRSSIESNNPLIISIAAGITQGMFNQWLGDNIKLVRCMPNTPALVQTGATGLFASENVSEHEKATTEELLSAIGIHEWVDDESLLNAVTALSGSGPAYFFLMMEAMIEAGEKLGLSPETAKELCLQTALGAAKMAQNSEDDVAELRRKVTSPNGTTEAALNSFDSNDFKNIVLQALTAADERSKTLAQEMS